MAPSSRSCAPVSLFWNPCAAPALRPSLLAVAVQAAVIGLATSGAWAQPRPQALDDEARLMAQAPTKALAQVDVVDTAEPAQRTPGASTTVSGPALEQAGSMADVVRYQPLVSSAGHGLGHQPQPQQLRPLGHHGLQHPRHRGQPHRHGCGRRRDARRHHAPLCEPCRCQHLRRGP
ncbi:hypothetical protein [Delftia sp.]|uniref:hypothetical protein n=1 Tax=Delftia sp. TaxID=1886637 RepID=UPI00259CFDD7|nr:hypothetical protein [Delftia sp.]